VVILTEHPHKNLIHIAQLPTQIKCPLQLFVRHPPGDLFFFADQLAEILVFLPGAHGIFLHQPVSIFALHARFRQIQQKLPAEYQPAGAFQVFLHARRINQQPIKQIGCL